MGFLTSSGGELHSAAARGRGVGGALPPTQPIALCNSPSVLSLPPNLPHQHQSVARSRDPTAESEREDACARGRGSRCAVGAPGRCGARQRVGAAHSDTRARGVRVCAAEAKGSDRHCGSQRSAQPPTLPGLHREAGVPEGAHSDLVGNPSEQPLRQLSSKKSCACTCACIYLNFTCASFPSSRRALPAHGAACVRVNSPTDLLLRAFFWFNDVLTSRVCRLLNCTEERR